jgi:hypothetical protein
VGEPAPNHFIVVRALGLTDEERDVILDATPVTASPAIPEAERALIQVVLPGGESFRSIVDGLAPKWEQTPPMSDPTSPSRGLPVLWAGTNEIWLGAPGWDRSSSGGLWHSTDTGKSWSRVENFWGVSSIALHAGELIVAESFFERWDGPFLVPYSARVMASAHAGEWQPAPMPPYGARSEVELCGELDGALVVRIDSRLFRQTNRSLWRFLVQS